MQMLKRYYTVVSTNILCNSYTAYKEIILANYFENTGVLLITDFIYFNAC